VIDGQGHKTLLSSKDRIQREAIAKQLLAPSGNNQGNLPNKVVCFYCISLNIQLTNFH
jgi:hypothetical protein